MDRACARSAPWPPRSRRSSLRSPRASRRRRCARCPSPGAGRGARAACLHYATRRPRLFVPTDSRDLVSEGEGLHELAAGDALRELHLDAQLAPLVATLVQVDALHLGTLALQLREDGAQRLVGPEVDLQAAARPPPRDELALCPAQ